MKENERIEIEIENIEKLTFCNDKLVYCIKAKNSDEFLLETKLKYEAEYDVSFKKTNTIKALVEFINLFNNKIVISNLRFLKKTGN